jgi:Secretion system C-terminal sorting domain
MKYKKITLLISFSLLYLSNYAQVIFYSNGIEVSNSTIIYAGGSIQADPGTTIYNTGTIQLKGNWDNRSNPSIFNTTNGTVEFIGSNQNIGGTTGTNFHNLHLTGGGNYQCTQSISTGGEGSVQNGILALNNSILTLNSNILFVKNISPLAITRTTGFIDGETNPLTGVSKIKWKVGSTPAYSTFIFPFGNQSTNSFLPTSVSFYAATVGSDGTIVASTYPTDPFQSPNNRPLPPGIPSINDIYGNENSPKMLDRFWIIDFENFPIQPIGTMFFSYRDSEHNSGNNLITESSLRAQKFTNTWNNIASGGIVFTSTNTCGLTNITGLTSGTWALTDQSSPLPVELLSFSASNADGKSVMCEWTTASEINNDYFTIERSDKHDIFEEIGKVDGAGNSTDILNYSFTDKSPLNGINYYRLKQTDFDGNFTYSPIVAVNFSPESTFSLAPNPTNGSFYIFLEEPLKINGLILIHSSEGKLIFQQLIDENSTSRIKIPSLNSAKGIYYISIITEHGVLKNKIVIR